MSENFINPIVAFALGTTVASIGFLLKINAIRNKNSASVNELATLKADSAAQKSLIESLNAENLRLKEEFDKEKENNLTLTTELASVKAELCAKDEIRKKEVSILDLVKNEFANKANEILIEKQKSLQEENKTSLEYLLAPLSDRIKEFQAKVELADKEGKINAATIKTKIDELVHQNQITCSQTEKLSAAISQNSKFRGSMGEMILEKLLKSSGLIDKKDNPQKGNYETQVGFKPLDGSGTTRIVDAVVYLSEGTKSIVIDSKASLVDFIEFSQAEIEEDRQKYLNAFMNDVSMRVKELSDKYTNLDGLSTPDFTIMFIPFEYPLTYIYSNSKLIEDAMKQNVVIAGPSTLIATLRTINYSWAQKNQFDNIKDIIKLGEGIYNKCITLVQKLESVQTSFETVRKNFDDTFRTIRGRGSLLGQVEKLKEFGLSPSKQIDSKYIEDTIDEALLTLKD